MRKKLYYAYIVCFMVILLLPLIVYPLIKNTLDTNNYENRKLMTVDEVLDSNWTDLFPNLEILIEDNMPYKNESINAINWIDENVFHDLYNPYVIVGKENWLFYKGNDCIQDYRGGYILSDEELRNYVSAAESLQETLNGMGIELCIMITPNKEAIYGDEYLPNKVIKISDQSRADQVVEYLMENTNITIVYPKESLQAAAIDYQVWKKYDTHWNSLGAFVASQDLLINLGMRGTDLEDVDVTKGGLCSGDLANMLGMTARYSDDISYTVGGYNESISYETTNYVLQSNLSYSKFESDSSNTLSVLFIGDSFLGAMEEYLATDFTKTMFVHRDNYTSLEEDLILSEKLDIVVFQTAERFLTYFDDYMLRYAAMYDNP